MTAAALDTRTQPDAITPASTLWSIQAKRPPGRPRISSVLPAVSSDRRRSTAWIPAATASSPTMPRTPSIVTRSIEPLPFGAKDLNAARTEASPPQPAAAACASEGVTAPRISAPMLHPRTAARSSRRSRPARDRIRTPPWPRPGRSRSRLVPRSRRRTATSAIATPAPASVSPDRGQDTRPSGGHGRSVLHPDVCPDGGQDTCPSGGHVRCGRRRAISAERPARSARCRLLR